MYRHIENGLVENESTGERYRATSDANWTPALEAWRADLRRWEARLAPILARAGRTGRWSLYRAAKRATYRRGLPSPMPAGHIMFNRARRGYGPNRETLG